MACDFFISRAGENREIAKSISAILEDAGYSTYIQDKDFGFTAFTDRMQAGFEMVEEGTKIIALLSSIYQKKPHCEVEAHYPLIDDPSNKKQRLIVFRIEDVKPTGFLKPIPFVDLVPHLSDHAKLREIVLTSVKNGQGLADPQSTDKNNSIAYAKEIERIVHFLKNEDEQHSEKAFTYLFIGLVCVAALLLAFEQLLNIWNWAFGTTFYAIFDAVTVLFLFTLMSVLLLVAGYVRIWEIARFIENSDVRSDQLDELKAKVRDRTWRSKSTIEAAVALAARNILANKYRP